MPRAYRPSEPNTPVHREVDEEKMVWLLGQGRARRKHVLRTLAAVLVYGVALIAIAIGVTSGWIHPIEGKLLGASIIASCVLFYVMVRSGWSERFEDPALTLPQVMVANTWIAIAYAITNQAHGSTMILYALVMFFGLLKMDIRSARICGAQVIVFTGVCVAYKSRTDPARYSLDIEAFHYLFLLASVAMMTFLAGEITKMRNKLKEQRQELADSLEAIQTLAKYDELTGLMNRRAGLQLLSEYQTLLHRHKLKVWIALLDIDHFKKINDQYGHATGDQVLKCFAQAARQSLRTSDAIIRWGGEEFLVVMLDETDTPPVSGLERLRTSLNQIPCPDGKDGPTALNFSAGVTLLAPEDSLDAALDRADQALYRAKEQGRGRTLCASPGL